MPRYCNIVVDVCKKGVAISPHVLTKPNDPALITYTSTFVLSGYLKPNGV